MSKVELGTYIRDKREQMKVSQEAVAYALGISQAAYSKIERNETHIKVVQVYKIAEYLQIGVYDLLPKSIASDITGESLFGLIAHYIRLLYRKIFRKKPR